MSSDTCTKPAPRACSSASRMHALDSDPVDLAHREHRGVELLRELRSPSSSERTPRSASVPGRRGQRPVVVGERAAGEPERRREHHAVHVAARRSLGRVQVAVRVDPETPPGPCTPAMPAERAQRDRVVAAEDERKLPSRAPPRDELARGASHTARISRGSGRSRRRPPSPRRLGSTLPRSSVARPSCSARSPRKAGVADRRRPVDTSPACAEIERGADQGDVTHWTVAWSRRQG